MPSKTPETLWHIIDADNYTTETDKYSFITLHPMEIARQITLLTHDMVKGGFPGARDHQLTHTVHFSKTPIFI